MMTRGSVRGDGEQPPSARLDDVLAAVALQVRRELMVVVAQRPGCVSELAERVDLDRSLVSRHLSLLRNLGLLRMREEGQRHLYCIGGAASVQFMTEQAVLVARCGEGCDALIRMTEEQLRRLRVFPASPIATLPASGAAPAELMRVSKSA